LKDKIFAYLQLTRFPNLFTSMADILAGYLIIKGLNIDWPEFLALCLSTCFIYGGGCILNDVRDRNLDASERPSRPIPSGRVALCEAGFLTCIFFGLGLFSAFLAGKTPLVMASILILLAVSYDIFTKEMPLAGPINMAACRGANLLFGMSPAFQWAGIALVFPVFSFTYVFALTKLSHFEVEGGLGGKGWVVSGSLFLVVFFLSILAMTRHLALDCFIEPGKWIAYPWWTDKQEAPDFAGHVNIHNKPGYDPCELFFGWPPGSVGQNTDRIHGSHGRVGAGRDVTWASTFSMPGKPADLVELATAVRSWLDGEE